MEDKYCIVCCIYDRVAEKYSAPMLFENEDCAKRYFSTLLVNNPNKSDYELCFLGKYSSDIGAFFFAENDREYMFNSKFLMKGSEVNG